MGVNANVTLAKGAEWRRVGQVACVLLGCSVSKATLGKDGYYAVVKGFDDRNSQPEKVAKRLLGQEPVAQYRATHTPEYIDILVDGDADNPVAKGINNSDNLPYQMWYGLENKVLHPKATAAKIALAEGITKFFGGHITYNDYSGVDSTFPAKKFWKENDEDFYRYQDALLKLKPLTQKDLDRCAKYASY